MKQSQIVGEDLSSEPSVVSVKETTHYVESNFCKCGICEKIFFHSGTLNRHIKHVHGGEKTHSCDKCSAHYCRKEDLENHLKKGKHYRDGICPYCEESIVFKSETAWRKHFTKEPSYIGATFPSRSGKETCVNRLKKQREQVKEFLQGSTTCYHCNEVVPNKNADEHWITSDVEEPEKSTCMTNLERRQSMICWYCKGEINTKDYISQFHNNQGKNFHHAYPRHPHSCHESHKKRNFKEHLIKEEAIKNRRDQRWKRKGLLNENGECVEDMMKSYQERYINRHNWGT